MLSGTVAPDGLSEWILPPPAAREASWPGSPRSTIRTPAPRLRKAMARESPMIPPPTIMTSQVFTTGIVKDAGCAWGRIPELKGDDSLPAAA